MIRYHKFNGGLPEYYIIRKKQCVIYVLGVEHTNDTKNPEVRGIEELLNNFLLEKNILNRVVLVEGGDWPVESSKKEAISNYGEMAYVVYLANKNHLEVCSPEISESDEIKILLKSFSKDEIIDYYFTRSLPQWQRSNRCLGLEEYLNMGQYSKITKWMDYNFSLKHITEIHSRQNNHIFDQESCGLCMLDKNSINYRVSLASIKIRDNFVYKKIKEFWKNKRSIFLVFGRSHTRNLKGQLTNNLSEIVF